MRTPFGITLQGIRDEPTRMRALGYNVELHRTLAFGVGAFIAGIAGILFTWWNGNISPGAINLGATLDLLVIAVVGGLYGSRAPGSARSSSSCSTTRRGTSTSSGRVSTR